MIKTVFFLVLFLFAGRQRALAVPSSLVSRQSFADTIPANQITYKIFSAADSTFGYDIYMEGRRFIHQSSIPGVAGNKGFRRKRDAEKVAALVVEKLNRKIMPPSVTKHEMDSLKVRY
jgi:Domain of unknown function (DUF4907)